MARTRQTPLRSAQSRRLLDVSLNSQTPVQTMHTNPDDYDELYSISPQSRKPSKPRSKTIKPLQPRSANIKISNSLFSNCPIEAKPSKPQTAKRSKDAQAPSSKPLNAQLRGQVGQTSTLVQAKQVTLRPNKSYTSALEALHAKVAAQNLPHAPPKQIQQREERCTDGQGPRTGTGFELEERSVAHTPGRKRNAATTTPKPKGNTTTTTPSNRMNVSTRSKHTRALDSGKSTETRITVPKSKQTTKSYGERVRKKVGELPIALGRDNQNSALPSTAMGPGNALNGQSMNSNHHQGVARIQDKPVAQTATKDEQSYNGRFNPRRTSERRRPRSTVNEQLSSPSHVSNTPQQAHSGGDLQHDEVTSAPATSIPDLQRSGDSQDCPITLSDGEQSSIGTDQIDEDYALDAEIGGIDAETPFGASVANSDYKILNSGSLSKNKHITPKYDLQAPRETLIPQSQPATILRLGTSTRNDYPTPQTRNVATNVINALDEMIGKKSPWSEDRQNRQVYVEPAPVYNVTAEQIEQFSPAAAQMIEYKSCSGSEESLSNPAHPHVLKPALSPIRPLRIDPIETVPAKENPEHNIESKPVRFYNQVESIPPDDNNLDTLQSTNAMRPLACPPEKSGNDVERHVQPEDSRVGLSVDWPKANPVDAQPAKLQARIVPPKSDESYQISKPPKPLTQERSPEQLEADIDKSNTDSGVQAVAVTPSYVQVWPANEKPVTRDLSHPDNFFQRPDPIAHSSIGAGHAFGAAGGRASPNTQPHAQHSEMPQTTTPPDSLYQRIRELEQSLAQMQKRDATTDAPHGDDLRWADRTSDLRNITSSSPFKRRRIQPREPEIHPPIDARTLQLEGLSRWRHALQPHQLDLFDELITVSHRLVRTLVTRETAEIHRVDDFVRRGTRMTDQMVADVAKRFEEFAAGAEALRQRVHRAAVTARERLAGFRYAELQQARNQYQRQVHESEMIEAELAKLLKTTRDG